MHTPTHSSFLHIFLSQESQKVPNDEKVCTLFSRSLLLSLKKKKKKEKELKNLQKKIKKTNALPHTGSTHTPTTPENANGRATRERESARERARERARESDGRTKEVLSFFSRAGTSHPSRFFKTRFRGGRWKTKRHLICIRF